jgi:hypothetical protein
MSIAFFILGLVIGIELRKPCIGHCIKVHRNIAKRMNRTAIEKNFYRKKAGFKVDEEMPEELKNILKKYNLYNIK